MIASGCAVSPQLFSLLLSGKPGPSNSTGRDCLHDLHAGRPDKPRTCEAPPRPMTRKLENNAASTHSHPRRRPNRIRIPLKDAEPWQSRPNRASRNAKPATSLNACSTGSKAGGNSRCAHTDAREHSFQTSMSRQPSFVSYKFAPYSD